MASEPVNVRVYTDMVGDLFHWGHVAFLERARALGTELWVGVHADDEVVEFGDAEYRYMETSLSIAAKSASPRWTRSQTAPCTSASAATTPPRRDAASPSTRRRSS